MRKCSEKNLLRLSPSNATVHLTGTVWNLVKVWRLGACMGKLRFKRTGWVLFLVKFFEMEPLT